MSTFLKLYLPNSVNGHKKTFVLLSKTCGFSTNSSILVYTDSSVHCYRVSGGGGFMEIFCQVKCCAISWICFIFPLLLEAKKHLSKDITVFILQNDVCGCSFSTSRPFKGDSLGYCGCETVGGASVPGLSFLHSNHSPF